MVHDLIHRTFLKFLGIFIALILLFAVGTYAYHTIEGWSYTDSFYFTGVTLTTIGYGDLHPTTDISKIFTVFFALAGVGIILTILTFLGQHFLHREREFQKKYATVFKNRINLHKTRIKKHRNDLVKHNRH